MPPPAFMASARPVSVRKTDRYFSQVVSPSRAKTVEGLLTVGTFTKPRQYHRARLACSWISSAISST